MLVPPQRPLETPQRRRLSHSEPPWRGSAINAAHFVAGVRGIRTGDYSLCTCLRGLYLQRKPLWEWECIWNGFWFGLHKTHKRLWTFVKAEGLFVRDYGRSARRLNAGRPNSIWSDCYLIVQIKIRKKKLHICPGLQRCSPTQRQQGFVLRIVAKTREPKRSRERRTCEEMLRLNATAFVNKMLDFNAALTDGSKPRIM